ncbi:NlpC/P60 family protein [Chitinasiproducens palmae]|uniref:NlpC/P60 domain-containing protein n=1 Tax=Chitinasiproducens palmae TaxID=1770053 RepID=A0A1H2PU45_9BURK|nr:C40 family peptidase [Chitinasiproducens palmae]SDV49829.1 hypothetical protein SAMN05216551_109174 [Chitinasiproducens palmae]
MNASDAAQYIGKRWEAGARGPDAWDCWGLLLHVQREHFGLALPELPGTEMQTRAVYQGKLVTGEWELIDRPEHGAGALLRGGREPHVGVWLAIEGGGVLHALEGFGVIWTPGRDLRRLGYSRTRYHRFIA